MNNEQINKLIYTLETDCDELHSSEVVEIINALNNYKELKIDYFKLAYEHKELKNMYDELDNEYKDLFDKYDDLELCYELISEKSI